MSKSNKSSSNYRVEGNMKTVISAMNEEIEDAIFAKVMKNLGNSRVSVYFENDKKQGCLGIALIRSLLRRKGQVPITVNDIVVVTPRTFEADNAKKHFDLICVLTKKDGSMLKKAKKIPEYFLHDMTSNTFVKKHEDDGIEFDYAADDKKMEAIIDAI